MTDPWKTAGRRFERIEGAVERGARATESKTAERFSTLASLLAPVDTGALSRSLTPHDDGTVTITDRPGDQDPADYIEVIEYGTSRVQARPFLRPAASRLATEVPAIARREISAEVAREVAAIKAGRRGRI